MYLTNSMVNIVIISQIQAFHIQKVNAKLQILSYGLAKENCIITYDMVIEMIERFTYNGRAQKWMYT